MDRQAYIDHILDHYQHPRHKQRMEDADIQLGGGNPGCGDLITVYLKTDGDRITEITFEGEKYLVVPHAAILVLLREGTEPEPTPW